MFDVIAFLSRRLDIWVFIERIAIHKDPGEATLVSDIPKHGSRCSFERIRIQKVHNAAARASPTPPGAQRCPVRPKKRATFEKQHTLGPGWGQNCSESITLR